MRETEFSNCERSFILRAIENGLRLDTRKPFAYRKIKITFGEERGCCQVELGHTRVLAQVSASITAPKENRPVDGILFINVELSPMASPSFESGRFSDKAVYVNRLLERCLRESRCLETESLCITAGEKVWTIRIDINILNHDGNMVDCANIAAVSALAHFRRPDVTVSGDEITVHPVEEREPVPLSIYHWPICISFAFFHQGKYLLVDPTEKEEKVMDGKMVIGMNKHREICTFQMTGKMLLLQEQVLRCSSIAVVRVKEITALIERALKNDADARAKLGKYGFAESVQVDKISAMHKEISAIDLSPELPRDQNDASDASSSENSEEEVSVQIWGAGTGHIGEGGPSTWDEDLDEMEDSEEEPVIMEKENSVVEQIVQPSDPDDSEEDPVILEQDDKITKSPVAAYKSLDLSQALKKRQK